MGEPFSASWRRLDGVYTRTVHKPPPSLPSYIRLYTCVSSLYSNSFTSCYGIWVLAPAAGGLTRCRAGRSTRHSVGVRVVRRAVPGEQVPRGGPRGAARGAEYVLEDAVERRTRRERGARSGGARVRLHTLISWSFSNPLSVCPFFLFFLKTEIEKD